MSVIGTQMIRWVVRPWAAIVLIAVGTFGAPDNFITTAWLSALPER